MLKALRKFLEQWVYDQTRMVNAVSTGAGELVAIRRRLDRLLLQKEADLKPWLTLMVYEKGVLAMARTFQLERGESHRVRFNPQTELKDWSFRLTGPDPSVTVINVLVGNRSVLFEWNKNFGTRTGSFVEKVEVGCQLSFEVGWLDGKLDER